MTPARFVPHVEPLDARAVPDAAPTSWPREIGQAVGTDGGPPVVHLLEQRSNRETEFLAYDPSFRGGVRTAVGDVTGDGVPDVVTAAGPGGGPHVKAFDGKTGAEVRSFFAYAPDFTGGVEVAVGDVNRDGVGDIITGAGSGGGPHVKAFDGKTGRVVVSFYAFAPNFAGGVFVASGDLNRDGVGDIITGAGRGGGPHVKAFDGKTGREMTSFYAFDPRFGGGARVASGDLNADGVDDLIVAAGPGGGPHVRAIDPRTGAVLFDRFVADVDHRGGVRPAVAEAFGSSGEDSLVTATRSGDVVQTRTFSADPSFDLTQDVWVGDGDPPADLNLNVTVLPRSTADITPIRTIEGTVTEVAADGKSMTVRRGDGSAVEIDLDGDDPLPLGWALIDGVLLPPADILLGDESVGPDQLHVGRWVRVQVARAWDLSATAFTALSVRLL